MFKSKIFIKILFSYIIVLVLPIFIIGSINYYKTIEIVDTQLEKINMMAIEKVMDSYDKTFKDISKIAILINDLPWLEKAIFMSQTRDYDQIELIYIISQLRSNKSNNSYIKDISIIIRDGNLVIDCDSAYSIDEYFKTKYIFQSEAFNGFEDIDWNEKRAKLIANCGLSRYGTDTGKTTLYLCNLPLHNSYFNSLVLIQLDQIKLQDALDKFTLGEKTTLLVLNEKNELFQPFDDTYALFLNKLALDSMQGSGSFKAQEELFSYYYTTSKYNNYKYVAIVDKKSVMTQVNKIKEITYLLVGFSLLLGLSISYIASVNNYKPILELVKKFSFNSAADKSHKRVNELSLIEQALNSLNIEKDILKKNAEAQIPVIRNNLLLKLLKGSFDKNKIEDELINYGIDFKNPAFTVVLMEIELMDKQTQHENLNNVALSTLLYKYIQNFLETSGDICYIVEIDTYNYTIIINSKNTLYGEVIGNLKSLVKDMRDKLKNRYEIIITSALGNIHFSINEISDCYNEARKALDYKFSKLDSEIICYADIRENISNSIDFPTEYENKLPNLIKTGDTVKVLEYVDEILNHSVLNKNLSKNNGMFVLNQLISIIIKVIHEVDFNKIKIINYSKIEKLRNFSDMSFYIKDICEKVCEIVNTVNKEKINETTVKEIISFIDNNYCESGISLTMLSEKYNLSSSYISKLIKDYLGSNFIDYINKKRIEKAKHLLLQPGAAIKDVSLAVGYESDINFRRVFKKYEAITPGEYRGISIS